MTEDHADTTSRFSISALRARLQADPLGWQLPLVLLLALLGGVIAVPVQLFADGHEYLPTVASLLHTHNVVSEYEDQAAAAAGVSPETYLVYQPHGQNARINPSTGERTWGSHTLYVSILAAPFVALFGAKGFSVLNALCLVYLVHLLYRQLREFNTPPVSACLSVLCVGLTGAPSYVFWVNSEMLLMTALFAGMYHGLRLEAYRGMALLALAGAIKEPVLAAALPLLAWQFYHRRCWRGIGKSVAVLCACLLPHLFFDWWVLGRVLIFTVSGGTGEQATQTAAAAAAAPGFLESLPNRLALAVRFISFQRLFTFWFDPGLGAVWVYPTVLWCLFRQRFPWWMLSLVLLAALAVSVMTGFIINFVTAGPGIRYATMVFPMFLVLAGRWRARPGDWAFLGFAALLGGPLLLNTIDKTRDPEQVYKRPLPMMEFAKRVGWPVYPELLYHTGQRLPRGTVVDYLDNKMYFRDDQAILMIRNARPGNAILKFLAHPAAAGAAVQGVTVGGGSPGRVILEPGRVAALRVAIPEGALESIPYPEWKHRPIGQRQGLTARIRLAFDGLTVVKGEGELRWQERYHSPSAKPFLYRTGPRLVDVIPNEDWIIQTIASASLGDEHENIGPGMVMTDSQDVKVFSDPSDPVEGSIALRFVALLAGMPRVHALYPVGPVELKRPASLELTHVNMTGYTKLIGLAQDPRTKDPAQARVVVRWFDAAQREIKLDEVQVMTQEQLGRWVYINKQIPVPEGAVSVQSSVEIGYGTGEILVDDLTLSWFQDPWS